MIRRLLRISPPLELSEEGAWHGKIAMDEIVDSLIAIRQKLRRSMALKRNVSYEVSGSRVQVSLVSLTFIAHVVLTARKVARRAIFEGARFANVCTMNGV